MAFLFIRAKIIKASSGKSAVAAAAYQAAQKLHDDSLGMTFQYRHKEEVVFSEILLPSYAPAAYEDRETLWNAVQAKERNANGHVARQFIIAMPKEWTREESISRAREFIQRNLVDTGMVVDWAYHMKEGNPHLHCLCTNRGFKKDGSWDARERKEYALDETGQRIPEIDPKTGEQKIRTRNRNGSVVSEKIWKRKTVQSNPWNSRQFLHELKRSWVSYCNSYLQGESQIDNRSTHEQESNRVPLLHEGPEARAALERGIVFDVIKENQERRRINAALARIEQLIRDARKLLDELREKFIKWRESHGQKRSITAHELIRRNGGIAGAVPGADPRNAAGAGAGRTIEEIIKAAEKLNTKTEHIRKRQRR
ncbi:MAG: MobA/MobL family protein [Clostridia bacterium]|nr:MobA/MobL family protein [Clostridia bacterium]